MKHAASSLRTSKDFKVCLKNLLSKFQKLVLAQVAESNVFKTDVYVCLISCVCSSSPQLNLSLSLSETFPRW